MTLSPDFLKQGESHTVTTRMKCGNILELQVVGEEVKIVDANDPLVKLAGTIASARAAGLAVCPTDFAA